MGRRTVVRDAPPGVPVEDATVEKEHGVDVRTDEMTAECDVVTGIADDRRLGGGKDRVRAGEHLGGPGATGKERHHIPSKGGRQ